MFQEQNGPLEIEPLLPIVLGNVETLLDSLYIASFEYYEAVLHEIVTEAMM
jgi:hypothetical protein